MTYDTESIYKDVTQQWQEELEEKFKRSDLEHIQMKIKRYEKKLSSTVYDSNYEKYYRILQIYRALYKQCEKTSSIHDIRKNIERAEKQVSRIEKTIKGGNMTSYSLESFTEWCDDVTIAEEGLKDAVKNKVDATAHDFKKFFTPTDLDRADVKKVSSLAGLKNALFRKESVIRLTGSLKENLAKEIPKQTAARHVDTVIRFVQLLSGHYLMAALGTGFSALSADPAWKNAPYYSVVRTKRGAIYLVYGNYYKKKDNDYVHH